MADKDKNIYSSSGWNNEVELRPTGQNNLFAGITSVEEKKDDPGSKKSRDHKADNYLFYAQLSSIAHAIENMNKLMNDYGTTIKNAEITADRFKVAASLSSDIQAVMEKYPGLKGRHELLREHYGQLSATEGVEGNLWGSLQDNIIKDSHGHMVYEEKGELYRLQMDEEGNVVTAVNPETGEKEPVRIYYKNEAELLELYAKAYTAHPPGLFGNDTPFGLDPTNGIHNKRNQWGIHYKNIGVEPKEKIASFEETEDGYIGCATIAGMAEICTKALHELGLEIKAGKEALKKAEADLKELEKEKQELEKENKPDQERLEKLEEKIKTMETDIKTMDKELDQKIERYNNPTKSLTSDNEPSNQMNFFAAPPNHTTESNQGSDGTQDNQTNGAPALIKKELTTLEEKEATLKARAFDQTIDAEYILAELDGLSPKYQDELVRKLVNKGYTFTNDPYNKLAPFMPEPSTSENAPSTSFAKTLGGRGIGGGRLALASAFNQQAAAAPAPETTPAPALEKTAPDAAPAPGGPGTGMA